MIKLKNTLVCTLAAITMLPLVGSVASATTIEALETFDFPGAGNATVPQKINDRGVIVGTVIDVNGVVQGFYRSRNGTFSNAFSEPNDTGALTQGRGINNARTICGEYLDGTNLVFHGYFLSHTNFVEYDVPDTSNTIPLGINNAGDFVGSVVLNDGVTQLGFANIAGAVATFGVPEAAATLAYQLNASNEMVGYYIDAAGITHGYTRDSVGNLTFPIDPDGANGTILFGNNDANWIVGRYADAAGVTHGLFSSAPGEFVTYDYPGAVFTSLNGINRQGFICGRFIDAAGVVHGLLARVHPGGTSEPGSSHVAPAGKLIHQSPELTKIGAAAF